MIIASYCAILFTSNAMGAIFSPENIAYIAPSAPLSWPVAEKKNKSFPGINHPSVTGDEVGVYSTQTDRQKIPHIINALYGQKKFLWSVKGGYSAARLFKHINQIKKPSKPKVFIGFSDATFLHLFLNQKWGWPTIHGAMPGCAKDQDDVNCAKIKKLINTEKGKLTYHNLAPLNPCGACSTSICGKIIGGCLTLLVNSIGTGWQLNAHGKILMIEDVNLKSYELDRYLTHMTQAGMLNGVCAIIFGTMTSSGTLCKDIIKCFAQETKIPIFACHWFGHGPINDPIPFGCPARIIKNNTHDYRLEISYDFSDDSKLNVKGCVQNP